MALIKRAVEWLETEWTLAALGDPWRRVFWGPVIFVLTIVVELAFWLRGDKDE